MPMESYSYNSYAESGESSPPPRDLDFDNQQPWDDQSAAASNGYKVKFMCSYGGKIHPRPHDNQLSYVGGETKILAVDRFVKFATVMAKLATLCDGEVCFKYQLPGEDLDALISVTNDDDLEHMMQEYDRLNRASPTPARLRLFLFFPVSGQSPALTPVHSFGSTEAGRSERERFMDGLRSNHPVHLQSATPPSELMFGLEKGMPPQPSGLVSRARDHQITEQETVVIEERGMKADRIQKHIQDLQKLRIAEEQQPALYRRPSDDNLAAGYTGDYYVPKMIEKVAPAAGYQIPVSTISPDQQPVYMIQTPTSVYPSPIARPVTAPVNHAQGYYVQRMPAEVYTDQPVYNVMPPAQPLAVAVATQQTTVSSQQQFLPQKVAQGYRMVQSTTAVTDAQVAYDNSTGRQIYYTTHGAAVVAPPQPQPQQPLQATAQQYQAMAAAVTLNQENGGKVVPANLKELI